MRTNERYIKRIVVPVVAVAVLLIVGNLIVRVVTKDEDSNREFTVEATPEGLDEQYQYFSEAKVALEAAAMEENLTSLDSALRRESDPAKIEALRTEEVNELRRKAEESIQALRTASAENWRERKEAAYEHVEAYTLAIGQKLPELENN